jgi:hypothetical protein
LDAVTWNVLDWPTLNVVVLVLVIAGGTFTVRLNACDWLVPAWLVAVKPRLTAVLSVGNVPVPLKLRTPVVVLKLR